VLRSGRLVGLDSGAAELAALGLLRLAVGEGLDTAGGLGRRIRPSAFADVWLAFGDRSAQELRVPAEAVLRALVRRAAEFLVAARPGGEPEVLESLGRQVAETREEARWAGVAHPAEPTAYALVWHGVQALAEDADDDRDHGRRIEERCEAYIRDGHRRQDTIALITACARLAAGALLELGAGEGGRALGRLAEQAARHMPLAGPAPLWVPGRPV
jgi:hypothetical protein